MTQEWKTCEMETWWERERELFYNRWLIFNEAGFAENIVCINDKQTPACRNPIYIIIIIMLNNNNQQTPQVYMLGSHAHGSTCTWFCGSRNQ
jgi:hypothetical protein